MDEINYFYERVAFTRGQIKEIELELAEREKIDHDILRELEKRINDIRNDILALHQNLETRYGFQGHGASTGERLKSTLLVEEFSLEKQKREESRVYWEDLTRLKAEWREQREKLAELEAKLRVMGSETEH